MSAHPSAGTAVSHPYTCLSCSLAFADAGSQREHYATELHRYNSRRKVAGLAPVSQETFDEKIKERTGQLGQPTGEADEAQKRLACKACNKTFASAATHDAHVKTKKHKEAVFKAASKVKVNDLTPSSEIASPIPSTSTAPPPPAVTEEPVFESSGDAALDRLVAKRLQYAAPIPPSSCLFCVHHSSSAAENVAHMRQAHSFAIPEEEYLVDLEGLLRRLGEEVGTWNVCVCCGKGYGGNIDLNKDQETSEEALRKRASKGIEAVRAHMQSKSHCRLRYDTEEEQLNIADFYDFRPSYPDYEERQAKKAAKRAAKAAAKAAKTGAADGWEDAEEDGEDVEMGEDVEVVYEEASAGDSDSDSDSDSDDEELPSGTSVTYGDTEYELVLPSGARIGHRAHTRIHKQNHLPYLDGTPFKPAAHNSLKEANEPSAHSKALLALVPALRNDPSKKDRSHSRPIKLADAALVPAKGAGFGGKSQNEVIKARNAGEAKHAGKATREHTAMRKFSERSLAFGIKGNNQKHFRDFLLQ
ncbi:hypothetical protein JCM11251_000227 [Rhodosporidiobolus azoricus]